MPTDLPPDWVPEEEQKRRESLATSGRAVLSAVNWLYWVAGITLVNGFFQAFDRKPLFTTLGLGFTWLSDEMLRGLGGRSPGVTLFFAFLSSALVAALGFLGKRYPWAFVVAILLLTLDTVLMFKLGMKTLGILFRFWVVGALMNGLVSLQKIKASVPAS